MKFHHFFDSSRSLFLRSENINGLLFVLPLIFGFLAFQFYPLLASVFLSLTRYNLLQPARWVGIGNFLLLLKDPDFYKVLWNTVYFTAVSIPAGMIGGLFLALLVNHKLKTMTLFRTIYFLPMITSWVVAGVVWAWLFHPSFGLVNYILWGLFRIEGPEWLVDSRWAMPAIIIVSIWKNIGYNMLIFLAGLQGIPHTFYEAAELDGAGRIRKLWHITIPLLSPTTFFVLIVSVIAAFQIFDVVYVMTEGGPEWSTRVIGYHVWNTGFMYMKMGYASAIAWVLFILIFGATLIQWRMGKRWVHY